MKKVKTTVSFIINGEESEKHRLGVNSLQYGDGVLYTASRDSTIKSWKGTSPYLSMERHTDWVNDIVLCSQYNILVSASSDTTLKVWDVKDGSCMGTIFKHTDYAKALAYAQKASSPFVASAGFDNSIYMWDLESLILVSESKADPMVSVQKAQKSSIYSLAISEDGSTLVSGSPEKIIRVWDPRSGKKQKKMIGHTDNVKSVLLNTDGTLCLSGSSDGTVKLWDLGQQRCVCTYTFDDAVWALQANPSFTEFTAGCRDGSVFKVDTATSQSQLLFEEPNSILKLLLLDDDTIWAATSSATLHKWEAKAVFKQMTPEEAGTSQPPTSASVNIDLQKALYEKPLTTLEGAPGIIKYHVTNNKRHILTLNSDHSVQLYDVLQANKIKDYAKKDFDEVVKELYELIWVPNWFSVDVKIGALTIHLSEAQCFNVEVNPSELGLAVTGDEDEEKLNLGHVILSSLFAEWKKAFRQFTETEADSDSTTTQDDKMDSESTDTSNSKVNDTSSSSAKPKSDSLMDKIKGIGSKSPEKEGSAPPIPPKDLPGKSQPLYILPPKTSIILNEETSSTGTGVSFFRAPVSEIGKEMQTLNQICPKWVSDCVMKDIFFPKDISKMSFILLSENEKKIPALPAAGRRLSAFRILRVKKIINFVVTKLKLDEPNAEETIEIVCNDQVLPLSMNLGTIKMCIWKSGAEMQLIYRYSAKKYQK